MGIINSESDTSLDEADKKWLHTSNKRLDAYYTRRSPETDRGTETNTGKKAKKFKKLYKDNGFISEEGSATESARENSVSRRNKTESSEQTKENGTRKAKAQNVGNTSRTKLVEVQEKRNLSPKLRKLVSRKKDLQKAATSERNRGGRNTELATRNNKSPDIFELEENEKIEKCPKGKKMPCKKNGTPRSPKSQFLSGLDLHHTSDSNGEESVSLKRSVKTWSHARRLSYSDDSSKTSLLIKQNSKEGDRVSPGESSSTKETKLRKEVGSTNTIYCTKDQISEKINSTNSVAKEQATEKVSEISNNLSSKGQNSKEVGDKNRSFSAGNVPADETPLTSDEEVDLCGSRPVVTYKKSNVQVEREEGNEKQSSDCGKCPGISV